MTPESLRAIESGLWVYPIAPGTSYMMVEYTDQMNTIDARIKELEIELQQVTAIRNQYASTLPEPTIISPEIQAVQVISPIQIMDQVSRVQMDSLGLPDIVEGEEIAPQLAGFSPWMIFLLAGGAAFMLFSGKGIKGKERKKR